MYLYFIKVNKFKFISDGCIRNLPPGSFNRRVTLVTTMEKKNKYLFYHKYNTLKSINNYIIFTFKIISVSIFECLIHDDEQ